MSYSLGFLDRPGSLNRTNQLVLIEKIKRLCKENEDVREGLLEIIQTLKTFDLEIEDLVNRKAKLQLTANDIAGTGRMGAQIESYTLFVHRLKALIDEFHNEKSLKDEFTNLAEESSPPFSKIGG